jgi:tRNA-2-methylthio-N6-dimethylallyladenosine synthase
MLDAMQRLYTRDQYLERVSWMKEAKREISLTSDVIVGFPGETEQDFEETLSLLEEVRFDAIFGFKYSPRPNTPSLALEDAIPDEQKARRLNILLERQRDIQRSSYQRHIGKIVEVMVEGKNEARAQWNGRTTQNTILNFSVPDQVEPTAGSYSQVLITGSFPNSLLGTMVL